MTSIVYQDRCGREMFIYSQKYPAQRSLFELKKNERILEAMNELSHVGNINIYLYKKGKLKKIAERKG